MKNIQYIWLIFPLSIFVAGFLVLQVNINREKLNQQAAQTNTTAKTNIKPVVTSGNEKALPYFILASIFIVLILVLPRLKELSISERSLVLKLVSELKEETSQMVVEKPVGQESLKTGAATQQLIRIREKIALVEELLK
ncbi:hypothetical protein [Pedobacter sp.]|uniref:hypothetical protein n=1 Tax=Pedobacter sp. TaxID=1411316 RepID=UPI003D7F9468